MLIPSSVSYVFLHTSGVGDPLSLDHDSQDIINNPCYLQPYDMSL